jgi:uncharacterized protein (TIGR00369 family)
MSVSDILDFMRQIVESLPHCKKLRLKVPELSQGKGTIFLEPHPGLLSNPSKQNIHSAVTTTLLDTLSGTVASSAYPGGRTVATLDLRIDHLRRAKADLPIWGRAECFHRTEDIAYVRGWAWQENEDYLIAKATGTFMPNGEFRLQPEDLV